MEALQTVGRVEPSVNARWRPSETKVQRDPDERVTLGTRMTVERLAATVALRTSQTAGSGRPRKSP